MRFIAAPATAKRLLVTALATGLCVGAGTALAQPAEYRIDPAHASVAFLVDHAGYAKVLGMFRAVEGSYRFDESSGELSDVSVTVETDTVFTNHERRDEHLRSDEFLDTREFPTMRFSAESARRTGERTFEVVGTLELLGMALPLTLNATWNQSSDSPFGAGYSMGISARGTFKRSAYGMTYGVDNGWVGDDVEIIVELEARRR